MSPENRIMFWAWMMAIVAFLLGVSVGVIWI